MSLFARLNSRWSAANKRRQIGIVAVAAVIVAAVSIAAFVMTRSEYVQITDSALSPSVINMMEGALSDAGIPYKRTQTGLGLLVPQDRFSEAGTVIFSSNIDLPEDFTFSDAMKSIGMSTTNRQQNETFKRLKESEIQKKIMGLEGIVKADITVDLPESSGFLVNSDKEGTASVVVTRSGAKELTRKDGYVIAGLVSASFMDLNIKNVLVTDDLSNILYGGVSEDGYDGNSWQKEFEAYRKNDMTQDVKNILSGLGNVNVSLQLVFDFTDVTREAVTYENPAGEGEKTGFVESRGNDSAGGTADYLYNVVKVTENGGGIGRLVTDESSVAVSIPRIITFREDNYSPEDNGGLTWNQFKDQNKASVPEYAEENVIINSIANATGISQERISVFYTKINEFIDSEEPEQLVAPDMRINTAVVVILGFFAILLIYGMLRTRRSIVKPTENEDEPKAEDFSTEINRDVEEESAESVNRKAVEFLGEKPEAIVRLLRGRIGEDTKKAAALLIALGAEKSARIFKYLKENEIEALTIEIANTEAVAPDVKEAVVSEFYRLCLAEKYISEGGIGYAKQILEQALGEEKAYEVVSKLTMEASSRPFEFIQKTEASQLLGFIQDEHPQIIALILSYLKTQQAAEVFAGLEKEKQIDVMKRMAVMDKTSPDVIKTVENALEKKLSALMKEDRMTVGGVSALVGILNQMDSKTEKNVMETLEANDIELAEEIKNRLRFIKNKEEMS